MEQAFLEKLAEKIRTEHSGLGNRLCIVMPNRRAGLFLKRYLVPDFQVPVWAPAVFSIEDFISSISKLNVPDPLTLMFGLYEAHCFVEKENAGVFDDFAGWSKGLIHDFDEIDQYMINPDALFNFLSETKAMNVWNMDGQPLTNFEQKYLHFFNSLPAYYRYFTDNLLKDNLAYHGLACRKVAEDPQKYLNPVPWDFIIFAGFNAITPAQINIIRYLIDHEQAVISWDADSYYIENPDQEAGRFLRKYLNDKSLGKPSELSRFFETGKKNINIAGVPRNIGQTRLAGNILKKITEINEPDILNRTAVVLADESLLLPLLNAVPAEVGQFNITMGYPLQQSPLYGFFDTLIGMHENASPGKDASKTYFYHKDVLALIQNPYTSLIINTEQIRYLTDNLKSAQYAFQDADSIFGFHESDSENIMQFRSLFAGVASVSSLTGLIINAIGMLQHSLETNESHAGGSHYSAEGEILYNLALISNRLHSLIGKNSYINAISTIHTLFREAAAAMPVPFYGEPLEGIQVMGMLETRTLDFENVILISANEDTLPSKKTYNSFIPFEVRQTFGLPTHHDQQAVFAYHFYRLLQRCSNAWLIYNAEADELGGGEKSRFISQLSTEMPAVNPDINITEIKPGSTAIMGESQPIVIEKTPVIFNKLRELAEKGYSPTALNTYLTCALKFYFTYILKLGEPDETEETIDHRTLGIVIHEVLQNFYKPFKGNLPAEEDYLRMKEQTSDAIKTTLQKHFTGGDVEHGKNLLIVKVANIWINRFLRLEAEELLKQPGNQILGLEVQLDKTLNIELPEAGITEIKLKGIADRIDKISGIIRIIDYKTGKTEPIELKIKSVDELFEDSPKLKDKAFQLLFYQLLVTRNILFPESTSFWQAGIISFRSLKEGFMPLIFSGIDPSEAVDLFENNLRDLFDELYDHRIKFVQTVHEEHCTLCQYKTICHKTADKKSW